mgnify:FL=1
MSVTVDDVKYIAKLSMLQFEEDELLQFTAEFNRIIEYVGQINALDLSDVEPLYQPVETASAVLRDDIGRPGIPNEDAFRNAPEEESGHFKVPKVIGDK